MITLPNLLSLLTQLPPHPQPILHPYELILKLTPVRCCTVQPSFPISALQTHHQSLFSFYAPENASTHKYCLVYVTTLRLLLVPFRAGDFDPTHSLLIPVTQIDKCLVGAPGIIVDFHVVASDLSLQSASLHMNSHSRGRVVDIGLLVSAVRYAHAVAGTGVIPGIETGPGLFFKPQGGGIATGVVSAHPLSSDSPPSYAESERAVGAFFRGEGLLNQIVIRDTAYLENLQNLAEMAAPGFDYYYDQDVRGDCRPFLFLSLEERRIEYGGYYYRFLAENALRYAERNVDDIVQVIYDNLHGAVGDASPDIRASLITNNASTIILSLSDDAVLSVTDDAVSSFTNNASGNPHRSRTQYDLGVPVDSQLLVELEVPITGLVHLENTAEDEQHLIMGLDTGETLQLGADLDLGEQFGADLDFFSREGYSQITRFLEGSLLNSEKSDKSDANSVVVSVPEHVLGLDELGVVTPPTNVPSEPSTLVRQNKESVKSCLRPSDLSSRESVAQSHPSQSVSSHSPVISTKEKLSSLKNLPNNDFVLNNNRFLENATDQSAMSYLNHRSESSESHNGPVLPASPTAFASFCLPSTTKNFTFFKQRQTSANSSKSEEKQASLPKSILKKKSSNNVVNTAKAHPSNPSTHSTTNTTGSVSKDSSQRLAKAKKITTSAGNLRALLNVNLGSAKNEGNVVDRLKNSITILTKGKNLESADGNQFEPSLITRNVSPGSLKQQNLHSYQYHTPQPSSTHSSRTGTTASHDRDFSSSSGYDNPHLTYRSSSSSVDSSVNDVCRFYYEPENPYSDIVNNRAKYSKNRHKSSKLNSEKDNLDAKGGKLHGIKLNVTNSQLDLNRLLFKKHEEKIESDRTAEPTEKDEQALSRVGSLSERKKGKHHLKGSISHMDIRKFF